MARPVDGASNAREQASRAARRMRIKVDHRGARARKAADDVPDTQRVPDPFENLTSDGQLLAPPYNPRDLAIIGEGSTILRQCVDAYKINIHGHGIRYRTRFDPAKETEQARIDRAADEEELLKDFLESCNPEMSFRQMRQNTGEDKENVGYSGIEILRSSADGRPVGLEPLPGYLLRLGKQDTTATQVFRWRYDATQRRWEKKYFMRRLRVYATHNGVEVRYLKSYGDPRSIDSKTGRPVAGSDLEKFLKAGGELAHELLFFRVYSSRTAYGIPRWVGCSLGMAGSRAQENQNLGSLENNAIPPYALLTNAELDPATLAFLEEKFDEAADPERAHRPIIIQALPADASEDATFMDGRAPATKMELVRLSRPDEGMYLTYDEANRRKVQQSFRLPDILVGKSEHTFATAGAALRMAESQIFAPERAEFDWVINRFLLPEFDCTECLVESMGPMVTDAADVATIMTAAGAVGVGNPNAWTEVVERALGFQIPKHDDTWGKLPFKLLETLLFSGVLAIKEEGDRFVIARSADADKKWDEARKGVMRMAREAQAQATIDGLVAIGGEV
jgi:capsid portal protein